MIGKNFKKYIYLILLHSACFMYKAVQCNFMEDNYPKSVIEDITLDTAQLIHKYQYPVETHYITTEDKYILQLHRIPKPGAPPVFLMHGLQDSSSTWVLMGPDKALGYYLSDNGYDIWMGNARGNVYSRNHTTLNPDTDKKFWNFSWHEIGFIDMPVSIDYVLKQTGYKKLVYFGHSQGTEAFWVLCSMHPKYNDKIAMMHALGPAPFRKNLKSPLIGVAHLLATIFKPSVIELFPYTPKFHQMCSASRINIEMCTSIYYLLLGNDGEQTNATMFPVIFGHFPAGSSFKQLEHYLQVQKSNRFAQFDYGPKENIKRYGKPKPPKYPLEKITVPVGLYYTYNDYLCGVEDVKMLSKMLPNVIEDRLYPYKKWNHITMSWGIDARQLAHERMLEVMKRYPYE